MNHATVRIFSAGLFALFLGCSNSDSTTPTQSDPLCGRKRDNDQRCNPSRTACLRQADYDLCLATKALYRTELESAYLTCYPASLGCDSAAQDAALTCAQRAEDQLSVSSALTQLAQNTCQRCPNIDNDGTTDPQTCMTNLTTNANDLARALRYFNDATLTRLNTCLTGASPPADGCIAFQQCYQQQLPTSTASSCTADGGA